MKKNKNEKSKKMAKEKKMKKDKKKVIKKNKKLSEKQKDFVDKLESVDGNIVPNHMMMNCTMVSDTHKQIILEQNFGNPWKQFLEKASHGYICLAITNEDLLRAIMHMAADYERTDGCPDNSFKKKYGIFSNKNAIELIADSCYDTVLTYQRRESRYCNLCIALGSSTDKLTALKALRIITIAMSVGSFNMADSKNPVAAFCKKFHIRYTTLGCVCARVCDMILDEGFNAENIRAFLSKIVIYNPQINELPPHQYILDEYLAKTPYMTLTFDMCCKNDIIYVGNELMESTIDNVMRYIKVEYVASDENLQAVNQPITDYNMRADQIVIYDGSDCFNGNEVTDDFMEDFYKLADVDLDNYYIDTPIDE